MKITFTKKPENPKECMAYMDGSGGLTLKHIHGRGVYLYSDGSGCMNVDWKPDNAARKIYKGDSVTITF